MDSNGVRVLLKQREFARTNHYNLGGTRSSPTVSTLLAVGDRSASVPVVVAQTSAFEHP
jgi:hypothetical protein